MKHILLIIGFGVIATGQVAAQSISYWVGQSANPDPIMRHNEAFMDAFIKYIKDHPKENGQVFSTETTSSIEKSSDNNSITTGIHNDTCRVETVSSVTQEGRETIIISIGCGALVKYECFTESFSNDDILQTKTLLSITYQNETNRTAIESFHEFYKEHLTEKGINKNISQFS